MINSREIVNQFIDYIGKEKRILWITRWSNILSKRSKDNFVKFFNMNVVAGTFPYGLSDDYVIVSSNDSIRNILSIYKYDTEKIKSKSLVEQQKFINPGNRPDMVKTFDYIKNKYIYIDFNKFIPIVGIDIVESNSELISNFIKGISKING